MGEPQAGHGDSPSMRAGWPDVNTTAEQGEYLQTTRFPVSKATTQNPKDLLGAKKPSLSKIPPVSLIWESLAMMDGAGKYNPYNWRAKDVIASIYVDAAKRHLDLWFEGQRCAEDSGVHHLGHAKACCGILLDAEANGALIDDRPVTKDGKSTDNYLKTLDEAMEIIKKMQERHMKLHQAKEKSANASGS